MTIELPKCVHSSLSGFFFIQFSSSSALEFYCKEKTVSFDMILVAKLIQMPSHEGSAIVSDKLLRNTKLANNVFFNKVS